MSSSKTQEEIALVEEQIRELSIPYDYDSKEFPIEVVIQKFTDSEDKPATLFVPDYQRALVWPEEMKSRFIESLFLGVPTPAVFASITDEFGTLEIIDGSQRIRTINAFYNNKIKLQGLNHLDSLNGFRFSELSPSRQRKFGLITLRLNVITDKADLAIRADIFNRLNSTGKKLTPSERRKGAFSTNEYYSFILKMAKSAEFQNLFTSKKQRGEAEELVLRYFAYSESYNDFEHDVAIFLDRFIESKKDKDFDEVALERSFTRMLSFVENNFPFGFNKTLTAKAIPRVRFEAISVGTNLALKESPDLSPVYMDWLDSKEFKVHTTSDASNNQGKLVKRVEFVRDCLLNRIKKEDLNY